MNNAPTYTNPATGRVPLRDERPRETGCGIMFIIFALTLAAMGAIAFFATR